MKIRSFRENSLGDKCPVCKLINVNLIDVGDGVLGCRGCGCLFISGPVRGEMPSAMRSFDKPSHEVIAEEVAKKADKILWHARQKEKEDALQKEEEKEETEETALMSTTTAEGGPFLCECGKPCKTNAGLMAHKRHCEKK
jgi:hypothetical protein